ncbi:hypothetical protein [Azospirillum sp. sgz302134]
MTEELDLLSGIAEEEGASETAQTAYSLDKTTRPAQRGQETAPRDGDFEKSFLRQAAEKLTRHRILFLGCYLPNFAKRMAFAVLDGPLFAGYRHRQGILDQLAGEEDGFATLAALSQPDAAQDNGAPANKTAVLIDASGSNGFSVMTRFLPPVSMMGDMARRLAELQRVVVIIGSPELLLDLEPAVRDAISCVEIDCLPLLLKDYREDGKDSGISILDDLRQQIAQERWGSTPIDQFNLVLEAIQSKRLIAEILKRKSDDGNVTGVDRHEDIVRLRELVVNAQEPHATALFVATYFPPLGPMEFRRVTETLLRDRTRTEKDWQSVVGDNGEIRKVQTERSVSLRGEFAERWDRVRSEAQLTIKLRDDGRHSIDFTLQYFRRKLTEHFTNIAYGFLEQRFADIRATGLFYDSVPAVSEGGIDVAVAIARFNDDASNIAWLMDLMPRLVVKAPGEEGGDGETPGSPDHRPSGPLNEAKVRFWGRTFAHLLSKLFDDERLGSTARGFLNQLAADRGCHHALLAFLRHMNTRDPVALLPWYGRLLSEGSTEIRQETHLTLLEVARRPNIPLFLLIRDIAKWMPDDWAPDGGNVPPTRATGAARFIVVALLQATSRTSTWRYGVWPSGNSLLDQVFHGDAEDAETLARILTNPCITHYVRNIFDIEVNLGQDIKGLLTIVVQMTWLLYRSPENNKHHHDLLTFIRQQRDILAKSFGLTLLNREDVSSYRKKEIWSNFRQDMLDDPPQILSTLVNEWYVLIRGVDEQAASPARLEAFRRFLDAYVNRIDRPARSELKNHWREHVALIRLVMDTARHSAKSSNAATDSSRRLVRALHQKLQALKDFYNDLDQAFHKASQTPRSSSRPS